MSFARIDIAGRGNNAYRWAGETDVFEALDHCFANDTTRLLDLRRVIIRGFSMGGAGTWHLGLHHPGQWCAMSPGAGFTTTHGYINGLANPLPPHQEACLKIYDAVNYVENGFNVPIVAYSGGKDGQKLAADNIEARAKTLGIPMVHLIAPDEAHRFPPEYVKKAEVHWSDHGAKGRPAYAKEVRLTTYTLKYNQCDWVEILGLEKHYEKAEARAKWKSDGYEVTTTNVQSLHLMMEPGVSDKRVVDINGQKLTATPWINDVGIANLFLRKSEGDGKWEAVWPQRIMVAQQQQPRKIRGLQGPIDDAFADAFVCVRGTGKPWNENVRKYADADLARFQREWAKHMRGRLIVKDDVQLTNDDIGLRHLVLFGDPASNSVLAQVVDALPLQWSAKEIRFAGKTVSAADHVPVMIQPNPLNPLRYVVVNSGHTFHHAEFNGTNAQLYPRLGDFALLKITPTLKDALGVELVVAGLFDEYWRMPK